MNRVSLVCTVHEEAGQANALELHAILDRIQPVVIFLEVPPEAFDDFYRNCSKRNLESQAVTRYRGSFKVELVPVDLPTPSGGFFSDMEELHRRVRRVSPQYRRLMQLDDDRIREHGFAYLNTEDCSEHWARAYEDMVSSIKWMTDFKLAGIINSMMETNDLREKAMLANILQYCRDNRFDKGVFLVGAAHRRSVIEKAKEQAVIDSTSIQWDFSDWMNIG